MRGPIGDWVDKRRCSKCMSTNLLMKTLQNSAIISWYRCHLTNKCCTHIKLSYRHVCCFFLLINFYFSLHNDAAYLQWHGCRCFASIQTDLSVCRRRPVCIWGVSPAWCSSSLPGPWCRWLAVCNPGDPHFQLSSQEPRHWKQNVKSRVSLCFYARNDQVKVGLTLTRQCSFRIGGLWCLLRRTLAECLGRPAPALPWTVLSSWSPQHASADPSHECPEITKKCSTFKRFILKDPSWNQGSVELVAEVRGQFFFFKKWGVF